MKLNVKFAGWCINSKLNFIVTYDTDISYDTGVSYDTDVSFDTDSLVECSVNPWSVDQNMWKGCN